MLWPDRKYEIDERSRVLRQQVFDQRQLIWPDRVPRGLEVADPAIAAQVLGIDYQELEEIVFSLSSHRSEVAGLLDRHRGKIIVALRFGPQVKRFTAAHELGHWVLHDGLLQHRDLPIAGVESGGGNLQEREANHFAACFLMPRRYVADQFRERFPCDGQFVLDHDNAYMLRPYDVPSLLYPQRNSRVREVVLASAKSYAGRHFDSLAQLFKVSVDTMAYRIRELGLIRP